MEEFIVIESMRLSRGSMVQEEIQASNVGEFKGGMRRMVNGGVIRVNKLGVNLKRPRIDSPLKIQLTNKEPNAAREKEKYITGASRKKEQQKTQGR